MKSLRNILLLTALAGGLIPATGLTLAGKSAFATRIDAGEIGVAQAGQDERELVSTMPIERELSGGETHAYRIALISGQFLHVVVDQRGIDVVVLLFDPEGKKLEEVDSPNGTVAPEPISLIAQASGNYRLEIRSWQKSVKAGRYEASIKELRQATPQDNIRIAAQTAFAEGQRLRAKATAESLRKAIQQFTEAMPQWRELTDRRKEAETLFSMGFAYKLLGETQKAVDYYSQSLLLQQALGDRWGAAQTLNNLGAAYDILRVTQMALDHYNRALPILLALGERRGEAAVLQNIGFVYNILGDVPKAIDYYERALPIRREAGDSPGEATTLNNLGKAYDDLGD